MLINIGNQNLFFFNCLCCLLTFNMYSIKRMKSLSCGKFVINTTFISVVLLLFNDSPHQVFYIRWHKLLEFSNKGFDCSALHLNLVKYVKLFHDELCIREINHQWLCYLWASDYDQWNCELVWNYENRFSKVAIEPNISNLRPWLRVTYFFVRHTHTQKLLCICYIDHAWFIWCCICKSSLDSLIKMNFDAKDSYAGLCLNSPPVCWQAANPPLSYQLLLKSRLSFHPAGPVDGNELGIFRTILIRVVVHNTEGTCFPKYVSQS